MPAESRTRSVTLCLISAFLILGLTGCTFGDILNVIMWMTPSPVCGAASGVNEAHCYKKMAESKNDAEICEKVKRTEEKGIAPHNQCYYDIAAKNNNVSLCEKITEVEFFAVDSDDCIHKVVSQTRSTKTCEALTDTVSQAACLEYLASIGGPKDDNEPDYSKDPKGLVRDSSGNAICFDSDGGDAVWLKGYTVKNGARQDDTCMDADTLIESYCTWDGFRQQISYDCELCVDGQCYINGITPQNEVTSDTAQKFCTGPGGTTPNRHTKSYTVAHGIRQWDVCVNDNTLYESTCIVTGGGNAYNDHKYITMDCNPGEKCVDGACTPTNMIVNA